MAVPHVSGTAALMHRRAGARARPAPEAITQRLTVDGPRPGPPGYDSLYGWGLLDAGAATAPLIGQPGDAAARGLEP